MFFLLFIASLAAIVAHAIYFSRRLSALVAELFPAAKPYLRIGRRVLVVVGTSLPAILVVLIIHAVIVKPDAFGLPVHPLFDYGVVMPFWLLTIYAVQCELLIAPVDAGHWILRKLGKARATHWSRRRQVYALLVLAIFAVYMPARLFMDARSFEVRKFDIAAHTLPDELDGFKIALVADLQADQYVGPERIDQLVDAVNSHQPDLILIAGDIITRPPQFIDMGATRLGRLRARYGVLSCIGDHENFAYTDQDRSVREVTAAMERNRIPMLDNQTRVIQVGSASIGVAFVTNNYITRIGEGALRTLIGRTQNTDFQIALAHQTKPYVLDTARNGGIDLFLAGHAHGGQIRFWLPFVDLFMVRFETPYVTGQYRLGAMPIIVTSGLGMSVAPLRYRAPATAEIITLRKGD